jgi:hypothetical protein
MSDFKDKFNESRRTSKPQTFEDVINKLMRAYSLDKKLSEYDVLSKWEYMVGKGVSLRTTNLKIKDRILYVELNSSAVRNELQHAKSLIIMRVNQEAGKELITDIYFS